MSETTMQGLNWIPQITSNSISIDNTNRIKARLLTTLKLKYISTKEDNFKRMMLYFKILEPDSLNIVNQDMNDKGITDTTLPFWYNVNDEEFILKVSSHNCKCYANMPLNVGFEKDGEYKIDAEFTRYKTQNSNGYTCVLHNIIDNNIDNTTD